jgi:hypothetical protein
VMNEIIFATSSEMQCLYSCTSWARLESNTVPVWWFEVVGLGPDSRLEIKHRKGMNQAHFRQNNQT